MQLTRPQIFTFWKKWHQIVQAAGWDKAEAEEARHELIRRAGIESGSLQDVDKLAGFDRVLAELSALDHPEDLQAQLRQVNMPRTRLQYRITELSAKLSPDHFKLAYALTVSRDRFATDDLESLSDQQLEQLRNTLCDRLVQQHRHMTKVSRSQSAARRRATKEPGRQTFPQQDLPGAGAHQLAA